jgi:hypothetical protein
LFKR